MPAPDPQIYPPQTDADRRALLTFARETPLSYGTWGQFKRLYKRVEPDAAAQAELFGTLAARIDAAPLGSSSEALPVEMGPDVRGIERLVVIGRQVYCLQDRGQGAQK